jgi:hypothetical protein
LCEKSCRPGKTNLSIKKNAQRFNHKGAEGGELGEDSRGLRGLRLSLVVDSRHSWAASLFVVATCLWHVQPRRPTGPWLQVTLGVRRLGYLRELSERLQNLLIVEDGSRRRFLHFKLCADLLDLRLLLLETRGDSFHSLLLLCDARFLLCSCRL